MSSRRAWAWSPPTKRTKPAPLRARARWCGGRPSLWARIWSTWRASSSAWPCSHQNRQVAQIRSSAVSGLILLDQPGQRGAEVVAPYLQPVEPGQLPGAVQLGFGRLGQGQEVGGMPVVHVLPVAAVAQAFQGVFPDGVEQAEPGLVLAGLGPDQAAVHQRAQRVDHAAWLAGLAGGCRVAADGRRRQAGRSSRRTRQPGEQCLLVGGQQAEAPVQRVAQGPLPLGQVTRSGGQHAHPVIEPGQQRRGGSSRIRAAASSMASGRPSSRRQISATAWVLRRVSSKPGASARARAANRRTEA